MTPEEVLQRHLLMIDTKEIQLQTPVTPSPVRELQETGASSSESTPAGRHGSSEDWRTKEKRKLSVREIVSTQTEVLQKCKYNLQVQ